MAEGRRIKRIQIEIGLLIHNGLFDETIRPHYMLHGIPKDVKFVGMCIDPYYPDVLHLYLESSEFPESPYAEEVPAEHLTISEFLCDQMVKGQIHGNISRGAPDIIPRRSPEC